MRVLQGILSESKEYYQDIKKKIEKKLLALPRGGVKERVITGKKYYYLQYRKAEKVVHKYLGRQKPEVLYKQIKERGILKEELRKVNEALKIIRRSEGRNHV
jgi:hypothetical protein